MFVGPRAYRTCLKERMNSGFSETETSRVRPSASCDTEPQRQVPEVVRSWAGWEACSGVSSTVKSSWTFPSMAPGPSLPSSVSFRCFCLLTFSFLHLFFSWSPCPSPQPRPLLPLKLFLFAVALFSLGLLLSEAHVTVLLSAALVHLGLLPVYLRAESCLLAQSVMRSFQI